MLPLSRLTWHTAAFLAGTFSTFLVIAHIDNAFVAPQAPQRPAGGALGGFDRSAGPIPRQASQTLATAPYRASYPNGLYTAH